MTEQQAEKIANIVLGAAVLAGAYYVLKDPVLRRAAFRLARIGLSAGASWMAAEGQRAWAASAHATPYDPREPRARL
jgi:hypothetical protein